MNSYSVLTAASLLLLSFDSVLANSHLSSINLRPGPEALSKNTVKSLPLHDTFNEIYKRKHNVDEKLNLHPGRTDLVSPGKTLPVDDFVVYYPEKAKNEEKVEKEQAEDRRIPILLGSIGTGLNSEANASLELFPGSLSAFFDSVTNYFKEAYARLNRNLHNFFEAIDANIKKGNRLTIFEVDDYLF